MSESAADTRARVRQQETPREKTERLAREESRYPGNLSVAERRAHARAAELAEVQQHAGFLETVLDGIAQKAEKGQNHGSMHSALLTIHEAAEKALQRPVKGTRVRCLMPHRGEQGTVVGWDRDLGVALVTWDDLSGLPPEGVEPGEYTTDLNREG